MEEITITWHGPYKLQNIEWYDIVNEIGIYAIYRVFGNNETLLYIGKTERSFLNRINEHTKEWLCLYRDSCMLDLECYHLNQAKNSLQKNKVT